MHITLFDYTHTPLIDREVVLINALKDASNNFEMSR